MTLGVYSGDPGREHVVGVIGEVVANEGIEQVMVAFEVRGCDHDLFDALIRDHLADHPDNVLAAWIATRHTQRHIPFTR